MAKVIMIQGTMSGAGKSLLTAGLCRIFKEDGFRTAPFKSQNMALNSYITADGLEMGRAQAVQAEAAMTEPSVYMNPILLKPTTDTGSQVIVNGEVLGNMSAREYFACKKKFIPDILNACRQLAKEYDILVVEGAGSPAEINLKENDIVNMGLAEMLDAPVLLAGDIDRGGVFAQLYGTVALLEPEERKRIQGLLINKFRGDKSILDPGIAMLEEKTKIPVVGTIPLLPVDIEEEDSISQRLETGKRTGRAQKPAIEIAVVRFPRISNYTDLAPLESVEQVEVRYVSSPQELGHPDLIFLPGSKNTMGDLKWMRTSGMEGSIFKLLKKGTLLFGICGGYQMMGEILADPEYTEEGGSMRGMGLLPVETVFQKQKTRTRIQGNVEALSGIYESLSGAAYEGYEIHMGNTKLTGEAQVLAKTKEEILGVCKGQAAGTYIHGFFDSSHVAERMLQILAKKKGLDGNALKGTNFREYKEKQYQDLAKGLRKALDMEAIYHMLRDIQC